MGIVVLMLRLSGMNPLIDADMKKEITKLKRQIGQLKRRLKEADKYRLTSGEWAKKYEAID